MNSNSNFNSGSIPSNFAWYHPAKGDTIEKIELKQPAFYAAPTTLDSNYTQVVSNAVAEAVALSASNPPSYFDSSSSSTSGKSFLDSESQQDGTYQGDRNIRSESPLGVDIGLEAETSKLSLDSEFQDKKVSFYDDLTPARGYDATLNSDFFEDASLDTYILSGDKWNFEFSRRTPKYVIDLEELERRERGYRGVDAILFGKWHRVQREFMGQFSGSFVTAPIFEKATEVVSSASSTIADQTSGLTAGIASVVSGITGKVSEYSHELVEVAKDKLGMSDPTTIAAITKAEEKERLRRMSDKHDPMVEARKRRFEEELLHEVKPSC